MIGRRKYVSGEAARGFTLVELLVVVVVLGVLAGIALPVFTTSTEDSKRSSLEQDLAIMNKAIELYQAEHGGAYPGTLAHQTKWEIFVQQMTLPTDKDGAPGTRYGPYLRTGIPVNPYIGSNEGKVGSSGGNPNTLAWRYYPDIGLIVAATDGVVPELEADVETEIESEIAEPDSVKEKKKK